MCKEGVCKYVRGKKTNMCKYKYVQIQICENSNMCKYKYVKTQICRNTNMWKHKYVQIQRCAKKGVCCEDRTCCMEGFTCLPPPTGGCGLTRRNDTDSLVRSTISLSLIYCFSSVRVRNGCREFLLSKPPLLQFCPSRHIPNSWYQISNSNFALAKFMIKVVFCESDV